MRFGARLTCDPIQGRGCGRHRDQISTVAIGLVSHNLGAPTIAADACSSGLERLSFEIVLISLGT